MVKEYPAITNGNVFLIEKCVCKKSLLSCPPEGSLPDPEVNPRNHVTCIQREFIYPLRPLGTHGTRRCTHMNTRMHNRNDDEKGNGINFSESESRGQPHQQQLTTYTSDILCLYVHVGSHRAGNNCRSQTAIQSLFPKED